MNLNTDLNDPTLIRAAFGHYPSGVVALAAEVDGQRHVMVASSFMVGISMDPPLASFAPQHSSSTWPVLARAQRLGVSVLSSEQSGLCRQLSGKDRAARFSGVQTTTGEQGAVFIHGASSWMECSIYSQSAAGDHDMVLLQVHGLDYNTAVVPLLFHGSSFREMALPASA